MEKYDDVIDLIEFIANKSKQERICEVAEILASRIRNQRALGQD